jgi:GNAT superfamily N-acetyltransferase
MTAAVAIDAALDGTGLRDHAGRRLRLRVLGTGDFDRVRALNDAVIGPIADAGLVVHESDDFLRAHLGPAGVTCGVEADGALVACAVLGLPDADDPYNFGYDIGADAATRATVAHLDGCVVLPDWRGCGLQRRLADWRMTHARSAGRRIVVSAAAPRNVTSLANLFEAGLEIVALKPKFGGHLRFVLVRDLAADAAPAGGGAWVALDDLEVHRRRLAEGDRGVAFSAGQGAPAVLYRDAGDAA